MKRSRFSEEQIIVLLREAEAGSPIEAVCAAHNNSAAITRGSESSEGWRSQEAQALEEESSRLKRLVAHQAVADSHT
jgi:putative transposase